MRCMRACCMASGDIMPIGPIGPMPAIIPPPMPPPMPPIGSMPLIPPPMPPIPPYHLPYRPFLPCPFRPCPCLRMRACRRPVSMPFIWSMPRMRPPYAAAVSALSHVCAAAAGTSTSKVIRIIKQLFFRIAMNLHAFCTPSGVRHGALKPSFESQVITPRLQHLLYTNLEHSPNSFRI